jgi:hypothetical protein
MNDTNREQPFIMRHTNKALQLSIAAECRLIN